MSEIARRVAELPPEKLKVLLRQLNKKKEGRTELHPYPRDGRKVFPLSFAQQRLWFLDQLEPNNSAYLIPMAQRLSGELEMAVFERCLQEVIHRHESLRTTFGLQDGEPVQIIHAPERFVLPLLDLQALEPQEREVQARLLGKQEGKQPCSLERGPLLRIWLLRLHPQEHVLLLAMHHIVTDAQSMDIFLREVTSLYQAFANREPNPLAPLPIQYADFSLWQRQWLQGEVLEMQLSYWKQQLADLTLLELPTDYPRPAVQTHHGARLGKVLPLSLQKLLMELCQKENVTLFMLLLTAFQILLARYCGQDDISVGTPIANRARPELRGLIGFFVNTLVMRGDLSGNPGFLELLGRVREVCLDAYTHQDVPFEYLVEVLQPGRDLSRSPLFQVSFAVQQEAREATGSTKALSSLVDAQAVTTKFDLSFFLMSSDQGLRSNLEYNTDLFTASTIQQMLSHWQTLLEGIVADPQTGWRDLPLLTEDERRVLLLDWNATRTQLPGEHCLHTLFEAQAALTPDAIAVVSPLTSLSYADLNRRADCLAAYLSQIGLQPQMPVALYMEPSCESALALLAILKAGGIYLPLDRNWPVERLFRLLDETQTPVLLTRQALCDSLPQTRAQVLCLDQIWQELALVPVSGFREEPPLQSLAYVIYTSGSTGSPKGVMIPHQAIVNRLWWGIADVDLQPEDRLAQLASWAFDISLWELFGPWMVGATVVLFSAQQVRDSAQLIRCVQEEQISVLHLVPSLLSILVQSPALATWQSVRCIQCGGEAVPAELVRRLFARLPVPVHQFYGPTEASISVTGWVGRPEQAIERMSIGRPIANTQIYLVDSSLHLVPPGVRGELYIGGQNLALGYLNRPVETAGRFIPDPFSGREGARLYCTGDQGRYLPNGELEFLGRSDGQIKLRGYRIEVAEIEAALLGHPAIGECVVVLWDERGVEQLVAYLVERQGHTWPGVEGLRGYLQERLPDYMVPAFFVRMENLPLNSNGKVNRQALPAPQRSEEEEQGRAPRTPVEILLVELWREVLGREQVSIDDNFFKAGGHSLLVTRLMARLQATLSVELPIKRLFEAPTIAELAPWVEQALRAGQGIMTPALVPMPRMENLPLSFAQQRLWFLSLLEPESPAYLIPGIHHLQGPLLHSVLERSLLEMIRRHEILRTTFAEHEGQPVQIIHPSQEAGLPLIDLTALTSTRREVEARHLARQEAQRPCDLEQGPLLRIWLLRLVQQEHILLLTIHHILFDGWSDTVFMREIATLYQAFAAGEPDPLPPLPIQYADFALWQRQWLQGEILEGLLSYWRRHLAALTPLELPTDHPRPPIQTTRGALCSLSLPLELYQQLRFLSQQQGVTLFMLLLAAFQVLLSRYSNQDDICVGTPIANRTRPELEGLIGFFVNTLVMRADLSGDPSFVELLSRVREMALGAYAHQDVPFEQLVEVLQPERDLSRSPLFQVLFNMQEQALTGHEPQTEPAGLQQRGLNWSHTSTKFDLTWFVTSGPARLVCSVEYNTDLFEVATIERMLSHWQQLLEGIVAHPHHRLSALPWLSQAERTCLLQEWNATQQPRDSRYSLQGLIEEQVTRTPDAIAVIAEEEQLSYARLDQNANQLAHALCRLGVGPEVRVGIALERSLWLSVGLLAVLKAGGAYVPLDPSYPVKRLASILATSQPVVVLTTEKYRASLQSLVTAEAGTSSCHLLSLDQTWSTGRDSNLPEAINQEPTQSPAGEVQATQIAYVIYTSGSTGEPKGAMNTQQGICNRLLWMQERYQLTSADRVLQKTPISFDVSVWELFWPLLAGAQLVMARPEGHRDPQYLQHTIQECGITTLHFVPSMLQAFVEVAEPQKCTDLRQVFCSGEALSWSLQEDWFQRMGGRLLNLYGPTEAAVDVTFWECERESDLGVVPIGYPISNMEIYILDKHMEPVPLGVEGELYIGGVGLARGYCGQADLTAERFVPHPFVREGQCETRLYRTGDRARYREGGIIEYLGRQDQQVKLRGFRIELGEIERAVEKQEGVSACVVLAREDVIPGTCLVAYIVGAPGQAISTEGILRSRLQEQLPEYMVPAFFVQMETLPLTANGKIDRRALPRPATSSRSSQAELERVPTPIEAQLAAIWCQVLGRSHVGLDDNFFTLGGDSILSIRVIARARQLGLHLTAKQFFQYQTIARLAPVVQTDHVSSVEQRPASGAVLLTPIQRHFFEQKLPHCHHYNQARFLELNDHVPVAQLDRALWHLLYQHDALRLRFVEDASGWHQEYSAPGPRVPALFIDLSGLDAPGQTASMETLACQAQESLDLRQGPLLRCLSFARGEQYADCLLLIIHHLVIDTVSWSILLGDLQTALLQLKQGEEVRLPARTTSWQDWAQGLSTWVQSGALQQEHSYWLAPRWEQVSPLPVDRPEGSNTMADSQQLTVRLEREQTRALLQEVPAVYRTQINDLLLTALVQTFAGWTGQGSLLVEFEGHGREDVLSGVDLSRTVGWFTTLFPVLLDIRAARTTGQAIKMVKEQLRQIPQRGIGYGLLRYLSPDPEVRARLAGLPQAQVCFNYLGQFDSLHAQWSLLSPARIASGPSRSPSGQRGSLFVLNSSIENGQLRVNWQYSQQQYARETIQKLANAFLDALRQLIAHCQSPEAGGYTPSDFPLAILDQPGLDRLQQDLQQAEGQQRLPIEDIYPLSPMQEGLLFHSLYAPDLGAYHGQFDWTIQGSLDVAAWQRAWQQVIKRHPILRTGFVWEQLARPLQVVYQYREISWRYFDWQAFSEQEQRARLEQLRLAEQQQSFDLTRPPLLRLILVRLGADTCYFQQDIHHLLLDGWSQALVFKEVLACYQAYSEGKELIWPSPRPYRDYIAWLAEQNVTQTEQFWRTYLAGFSAPTSLAIDRQRQAGRGQSSSERAMVVEHLSSGVTSELQQVAQQHQLTMNTLVQGAWALLLARYSGQEDVVFGTTVSGRPAELDGIEGMIGLFINTLPVRVQIERERPLIDWLAHLQAQHVEVRQYEYTPLVEIQRWSEVPAHQVLFETLLIFQNYPTERGGSGEQESQLSVLNAHGVEHTNYPLSLTASVSRGTLGLQLSYDPTRFDEVMVTHMVAYLQMILEAMTLWQRRIADLPQFTEYERRQLVATASATQTDPRAKLCIHELFARQAASTPDAIALIYEEESLTYSQLNARANQLAHYLSTFGVGPEVLVGICLERSLALIVGLLGILKAGGAYIPLDPAYPAARLALMLEDSHAPVLLIQQHLADRLPDHRARVICLDTDWFRIAQESQETLCCNVSPDHLAYMIYTSGSTGRPKGVMVTHTSLANAYFAWEDAYHLRSPWSAHLQMASFSFDVFTGDLVRALCSGGRLVLCPKEFLLDARQLYSLMRQEQVNCAEFVPVVIKHLLHYLKESQQSCDFMQVLVIGSDSWYSQEYLELGQLCGPQTQLVNSYGVTEATVDSTYFDETLSDTAIEGTVPIGRPFAHAQVYLLDKYLNPVPSGQIGDLYIGGTGLARGYQNRPELTAERFIPHPWSNVPGARLYKTGDLARYQPDGMLVHIGRQDYQVKLRGYRIELEEIETVLLKHEEVRECLVLPWERGTEDVSLVAYVVCKKQQKPSSAGELRQHLQEKLPGYMVPSFFITLKELPRTPNGKVDRDALPLPEVSETNQQSREERAKTPLEDMLAQIWCEVLRLPQASVHEDFFESGGHSLLAMQLITRARALFQVEVPMRSLFEAPTIAQLARRIEQLLRGGQGLETPPLVPVTRSQELPLSFAQQRLWFLDQLEPESVQYLIPTVRRIRGTLDPAALRRSLQELTARHEVLRTTFQKAGDQPVQIIHPVAVFHLPVVDLSDLRSEDRERVARSLAGQEARHPCDLASGPLQRASLLRLATEDHVLLLTTHHIISDAWSEVVFRRELMTLYQAFTAGHPSPLPPLPIQYADFAVWQRQWLQGEVLEKQLAYWKQQLSGVRSLELPADYPRSSVQTFQGAIYTFGLPLALSQAIKNLSRQTGVTLFMLLLAAFQTLLYRVTGQDDIAVGTVIANRTSIETEALIGFFINTLVLRTNMHGSPTFRVLLNRVREMVLGAYTHQDVPFEKLVEALHFERVGNQIPIVQVRFAFQDGVLPTQENTESPAPPSDFGHILAKDEFTMIMMDGTQGLRGSVTFSTDLFKASSIKMFVSHFETVLNSIVAQPDELIDKLEMYTEEEKQQFALKAKAQQEGLRKKLQRTKRQEIDLSE